MPKCNKDWLAKLFNTKQIKKAGRIYRSLSLTEAVVRELVPKGDYCYTRLTGQYIRLCPFWDRFLIDNESDQGRGYCSLMEKGDFMSVENGGTSLLWDQVKECGINNENDK